MCGKQQVPLHPGRRSMRGYFSVGRGSSSNLELSVEIYIQVPWTSEMMALPGVTSVDAGPLPTDRSFWNGPRVKMGIYQGVPTKVGISVGTCRQRYEVTEGGSSREVEQVSDVWLSFMPSYCCQLLRCPLPAGHPPQHYRPCGLFWAVCQPLCPLLPRGRPGRLTY